MSIVRLRFKDINDEVIGDLEVSKEIPIQEMLPLILKQLGLDGHEGWKFVLEQNRAVDPRYTFTEVGARDGSVVRIVAADTAAIPLTTEMRLSITRPGVGVAGRQHPARISKQDIDFISQLITQQQNVLLVGEVGVGKSRLIQSIRDRLDTPSGPLYLDDFKSAKAALRDIARELHRRHQLIYLSNEHDTSSIHQKLGSWQIGELTTLVCDSLRGHGHVLIIDSLDTITPAAMPVLQELTKAAVVLAAVSTDNLDRLNPLVEHFKRIEIEDNYLDIPWIVLIAIVLLLVFLIVSQTANMVMAYVVMGAVSLLFLALRAFLWQGPNPKIKKSKVIQQSDQY